MRVIAGLDAPDNGRATVDGVSYRDLPAPLQKVGTLLEARAVHPGRSAHSHLLAMAQTHGIARSRVDELIEMVGLEAVARKRVGSFSLGMNQRLGVAAALLGDPEIVILDEPANGLDPEGIRWMRDLLKGLAANGRTVFLSSHLMSEIAVTAEHVVVIGRGRLIADTSVAEIVAEASKGAAVRVRTPDHDTLAALLEGADVVIDRPERGVLEVHGRSSEEIGQLAARNGVVLHELTPQRATLEDAFMRLTGQSVEFHAAAETSTSEDLEGVA
jgi:ABC-2 type transport system ATP-binding protein